MHNEEMARRLEILETRMMASEKKINNWKIVAVSAVLLAVFALCHCNFSAVFAKEDPKVIYIRDSQNIIRISIGLMPDDAPGIALYNRNGEKKLVLSVPNEGEPTIVMWGSNNREWRRSPE